MDNEFETSRKKMFRNSMQTWFRDWENTNPPKYEKLAHWRATDKTFVTSKTAAIIQCIT